MITLHSQRNKEHTKFRECLLSFRSEYFISGLTRENIKIKTYEVAISHVVVLYEYKTWPAILRENRV